MRKMISRKRKGSFLRTMIIGLCMLPALRGDAQMVEQARVTDLMDRWRIYNMGNKEVRGFRVQILATTDRRQMETVQRAYERKYPDYPMHFAHNEPYWYLKTGAFLTNQKAQAFMKQLSKEYPAALIVSDLIKGEEFLLYDQ